MNDFLGSVRDDLQAEIAGYGRIGQTVFADLKPKLPSIRERVSNFLNMPTEQRQALQQELGPQDYHQFTIDRINDAVKLLGPGAYNLLPYFGADNPSEPTVAPSVQDQLESLLQRSLYDDGQPAGDSGTSSPYETQQ